MIFLEWEHWDYHPENRAKDKDMGDRAEKKTRKIRDWSRWLYILIRGILRRKKKEEENSDEVIEEHLSELSDVNFQAKSVSHCEWK